MKKYVHYLKILNHDLFGGNGSTGYAKHSCENKDGNPVKILTSAFAEEEGVVKYIPITKKEYIEATEDK